MTRGAGPNPWRFMINPTMPEKSMTQISKMELAKE